MQKLFDFSDYGNTHKHNESPLAKTINVASSKPAAGAQSVSRIAFDKLPKISMGSELLPIDHCPMDQKEILDHSLLETLPIISIKDLPNLQNLMDTESPEKAILKLAANFQGGGLITGGGIDSKCSLDGLDPLPNFLAWEALLSSVLESLTESEERKTVAHMLDGIRQLKEYSLDLKKLSELGSGPLSEINLRETALKYANKVQALEAGQSQMLHGGYKKAGVAESQTLLFEVIRNADSTFDIQTYTSDEFQTAGKLLAGDKLRRSPMVRYRSVPENVLLYNRDGIVRPVFFQHLMEHRVLQDWDTDFVVDEEDVMEAFDLYEDDREAVPLEEYGAITGQRARTSTVSSTKAWMRIRSGNLGLHKQIMFHTQLRFLVSCYRSLQENIFQNTKEGAISRRLLRLISRNHLRNIAKAVSGSVGLGNLIDAQLAKQAQATTYHVLKLVEQAEKKVESEVRSQSVNTDISKLELEEQRKLRANHLRSLRGTQSPHGQGLLPVELPEYKKIESPRDFIKAAKVLADKWPAAASEMNRLERSYKSNLGMALNLELHALVDQLPLPKVLGDSIGVPGQTSLLASLQDEYWKDLTVEEMGVLIESFETLTTRYMQNYHRDIPTRMHATILPLQVLTHYLVLKIEEKKEMPLIARLENYKILVPIEAMNELVGLFFSDRNEYLRIQETVTYYNTFAKNASSPLIFVDETSSEIVKDQVRKSPGNSQYWKALLDADPKLKEVVDIEAERRWRELSPEEIKHAYRQEEECYERDLADYKRDLEAKSRAGLPTHYIKHPTPPKWLVNVPLVTREAMILEEAASIDLITKNALSAHGYDYINRIRRMNDYLYQFMTQEKAEVTCKMQANRPSVYSMVGEIKKSNKIRSGSPSKELQNAVGYGLHRQPLSPNDYKIFEKPSGRRLVQDNARKIAEGGTLKDSGLDPFSTKVLRTGSEWKLTPYQMIFEYSKELERLQDPSFQSIFIRLFFRSPVTNEGQALLGAGQLIVEDEALVKECKEFIQVGYTYYYNNRKDRGLDGARFFFEFAFFLSKYLVDAGKEDQAAVFDMTREIEQWLDIEGLSHSDAAVLHQYRVLFSSLKDPQGLESNDFAKIYHSWIAYNTNPDGGKWKFPLLINLSQGYTTMLTKLLSQQLSNPDFCMELGEGILRSMKLIAGDTSAEWKFCPARNILKTTNSREPWEINLSEGHVYCRGVRIGNGSAEHPWEKLEDFKRLFGEQRGFEYLAIGEGTYTFTHPTLGVFRIIQPRYRKEDCSIQRQFPHNERWYEYIPQKSLKEISTILLSDHAYWIPLENTSGDQYKGYITSLKDLKPRFATTEKGYIEEVDSKTGGPKAHSRHVDYLTLGQRSRTIHGLNNFEGELDILTFTDPETGDINQLSFPRYTSQEGNSLKFFERDGRMVWAENTQYVLPKTMPSGILGTIPNYIYLECKNPGEAGKLLVPFDKVISEKIPAPAGRIMINSGSPIMGRSEGQERQEQWGLFSYFVYNLENGKVKPTTLEGQLYLAYLNLSQKNYHQSATLLQSVQHNQKLSPMALKILDLIHEHPLGENHPDAKIVQLKTLLLKMRKLDAATKDKVANYFGGDEAYQLWVKIESIKNCLQSLTNISVELRFSVKDEIELLEKIYGRSLEIKSVICLMNNIAAPDFDSVMQRLSDRLEYLKKARRAKSKPIEGRRNVPESKPGRFRGSLTEFSPFYVGEYDPTFDRYYVQKVKTLLSLFDTGDSTSLLYSYPSSKMKLANNGKLFKEVYGIAKSGSLEARREMMYRLYQWRIHCSGNDTDIKFIDSFMKILYDPQSVPELPADQSPESVKLKFFDTLASACYNISSSIYPKKHFGLDTIRNFIANKPAGSKRKDHSSKIVTGNYPILDRSDLDLPEKTVAAIGPKKVLLSVDLTLENERWKQLETWKQQYIEMLEKEASEPKDFNLGFREALISEGEEDYEESLKKDLELLKQDYDAGKKENGREEAWGISQKNCRQLIDEAQGKKKEIGALIAVKKADLLMKANVKSEEEALSQYQASLIGGMASRDADFGDCVEKVLLLDQRAFQLMNDNLKTKNQAEEIAQLTIEIEDLKSYEAQLGRIIEDAVKIEKINGSDASTRQYLCQKLCSSLDARYYFDDFAPEVQVALRVFSGETGIIPFKKQTDLIKKMLEMKDTDSQKFRDIVIQLIMGGGKTSVLATIVLYLAAQRQGRMALFIVPSSLFETVNANFAEGMQKAFHKQVQSLDVEREDLTVHKLKQIQTLLQEIKETTQPMVMRATTIQCFELELLAQVRGLKSALNESRLLEEKLVKEEQEIEPFRNAWDAAGNLEILTGEIVSKEAAVDRELLDIARDLEPYEHYHYNKQSLIASLKAREKTLLEQKENHLESRKKYLEKIRSRYFYDGSPRAQKNTMRPTAESIRLESGFLPRVERVEKLEETIKYLRDGMEINREKIRLLGAICKQFPESADALMDEVDLLLDCLQEVNFPDGNGILIKAETNNVLRLIFKSLISDQLKVTTLEGNPSVNEVVGLQKNQQSLMDRQIYLKHVTPVIARELSRNLPVLNEYLEDFKDSFIRYAAGNMPEQLQDFADDTHLTLDEETLAREFPGWSEYGTLIDIENDVAFLRYLKSLYDSESKEQKNAANLMALTRHILGELTPATLSKSGRRDYGSSPVSNTLKIIPYLAVNTPATTEFGYYLEEACYYYQWAVAFPIDDKDVIDMAESAESAARYYMEKNGEKYEETAEHEEFLRLTGVPLEKIKQPEMLKQAVDTISADVDKRLDVQHEVVGRNVSFRSERLTSNGMALIDQLSTRRTMSGTPWNVQGYAKSLTERFEADIGTEGKILHTMAERADEGSLHEVTFTTISQFFDQILQGHPTPSKIRGIIEAGGIFKVFKDNAEVAENIMEYLAQKQSEGLIDTRIEGVLFFHKDPGQRQPDTLYVWKKGAKKPDRIGASSQENLRAKGLDPSKYFVYYDERHTTGTDVLQLPDAINLLTFDEKMLRRTIGQGTMRLRQYLFSQNVEVVVTKETRKMLVSSGKTLDDFILSAEKVQSMRKTRDMVRFFQQQIDNIFRRQAVKKIRNAASQQCTDSELELLIEKFEPYFVSETKDEPYLQHGRLKQKVDTKEMLLAILEAKLKHFKEQVGPQFCSLPSGEVRLPSRQARGAKVVETKGEALIAEVERDVAELKKHILESTGLPETWKNSSAGIGMQQEIELMSQVQTEQHAQVETEVETEIELELKQYEALPGTELRRENGFNREEFIKLVSGLQEEAPDSPNLIPLQDQLAKFRYGLLDEPAPYENAFSEPIFGTKAYFYTCVGEGVLPVFHKLQKPPKQILAVRSGENMRWLLLSEHEANCVREHLKDLYQDPHSGMDKVWLIQPDGSLYISGAECEEFPIDDDNVQSGLLELNAFGGQADFLDKHLVDTENWLSNDPELKVRFLKLRTARDKKQNQTLRRSPVIQNSDADNTHYPVQHMFSLRAEREKLRQGRYKPESVELVKTLSPKKVRDLNTAFVPYLSNEEQLRMIRPFQVPFVTPEQIKWLPLEMVKYLEKPEQIYSNDGVNTTYFLSQEQTARLVKRQSSLIPFVNPEFYRSFSEPWEVRSIKTEHLDKIDENSWKFLGKDQLKQISNPDDPILGHVMNLSSVPRKFGWLHGDVINMIPKEFLGYVVPEQIREMSPDSRVIISELEVFAKTNTGPKTIKEGQWTSWINADQVPLINFDQQLQYLMIREQIQKVPNEHVSKLNADKQVPLISAAQVPSLAGGNQIQKCPDKLVQHLAVEQLKFITDIQVPHLRESLQVQTIQQDRFPLLEPTQMQWISNEQLAFIQKHQICGLNSNQIATLIATRSSDWETLKEGLTQKQVESFDTPDLINALSEKQVAEWLPRSSVPIITKENLIQAVKNDFVTALTLAQLPMASDKQVKFFGKEQVQTIDDERRFVLLSHEQIKWMKGNRLSWIIPDQVPGLDRDQLSALRNIKDEDEWLRFQPKISTEQVKSFYKPALFGLLSKMQITNDLQDYQVRYLDQPWQIKAVKNEWVSKLNPRTQVPHIKSKQAPHLRGKEQIINCPAKEKYIHNLDDKQLRFLTEGQATLMSPEQIRRLTSPEIDPAKPLIDNSKIAPSDRPGKGSPTPAGSSPAGGKVGEVAAEAIRKLRTKEEIRAVSFWNVQHLTRNQLRQRSNFQFLAYMIGVITLGVVSSIVALVAYASLIPFIILLANRERGKRTIKFINANSYRLYRFFKEYASPTKETVP